MLWGEKKNCQLNIMKMILAIFSFFKNTHKSVFFKLDNYLSIDYLSVILLKNNSLVSTSQNWTEDLKIVFSSVVKKTSNQRNFILISWIQMVNANENLKKCQNDMWIDCAQKKLEGVINKLKIFFSYFKMCG